MSDKGKGPFGAQVTAVVLILLICVLCFPMPGGGLLITRLTGTDYVPENKPAEAVPVVAAPVDVPVVAVPPPPSETPAVTPPDTSPRFAQALDIYPDQEALIIPEDKSDPLSTPSKRDWWETKVEGKKVWVSVGSAMAWGPRLDVELSDMTKDYLALARSLCEKEKPVGAWALPTATEFDFAKVGGILKIDSDAKHKWLTWIRIPYTEDIPAVRGYGQAASGEKYSVRCIARTPLAPKDGYVMTDNAIALQAMSE